jgi:hypothetical protein
MKLFDQPPPGLECAAEARLIERDFAGGMARMDQPGRPVVDHPPGPRCPLGA